ncbi:MAG: DUF1801 domain-containing protein [Anaerolineales bacterium]
MPKRVGTVDELLATHTSEVRTLVERLRKLVRRTVPEATEAAHLGWHCLNYHHPSQSLFCGIFPRHDHVNLVFEFGILLPDPTGLLQGEGKQVRLVHIRERGHIRVKAIQQLIHAALDLPVDRTTKLELIRARASQR